MWNIRFSSMFSSPGLLWAVSTSRAGVLVTVKMCLVSCKKTYFVETYPASAMVSVCDSRSKWAASAYHA